MKFLFVIDPISKLSLSGDTGLALMEAAHRRGHQVYSAQTADLYARGDAPLASARLVEVGDLPEGHHRWLAEAEVIDLRHMDVIFMRRDPPFDMDYIFATYLLSLAAEESIIINDPQGLRSCNEKAYILNFPSLIPESLITKDLQRLRDFVSERGEAVVKPLDGKGGEGILLVKEGDLNLNSIFELLTHRGERYVMIQDFVPESREGDKRVILIDGEPIGAFLRVPASDDLRGNMCAGASVRAATLNERDLEICAAIKPRLIADGHRFVGIDLLGPTLSEINVTSPTGVRELKRLGGVDAADLLISKLES